MAIDLARYQKLKEKSERAKSEVARAEGVLEEQMKKLKQDFEVDTVEEAEKLLEELTKEEESTEAKYDTALAIFEAKWVGKL